jgi:hypothetical protein
MHVTEVSQKRLPTRGTAAAMAFDAASPPAPPPFPHVGTFRRWRIAYQLWVGSLDDDGRNRVDEFWFVFGIVVIPAIAILLACMLSNAYGPRRSNMP